jgi:hypothetical protein
MTGTLLAILIAAVAQGSSAVRTIDRGDQSNIEDQKQVVARTAAEWSAVWRQHSPDRPAPRVDFAKEMVVGVFLGSRTTAGYSVQIVSAEESNGAIVVKYRQTEPGRDAITAQILTFPYHLVAIPQSRADVKFERVP